MKRSNAGFTLIEVLVALFILAGGILMISLAWSGNFLHLRKSALFHDVSTLLERKMVEIEAQYANKDVKEIPDEDGGEFEGFPQYRWAMKSRDMKFPDLSAIIAGQEDGGDEMLINMVKQMTEYLNKTIKEVKVSIFVKTKTARELEFAATEYFIDYNQDFMGGVGGLPGGAGGGAPPAGGGGSP
jgi:general secretion pathway protein I